ncbi:hypothetical protein Tco_1058873, partial [Tanacetum coccineum]
MMQMLSGMSSVPPCFEDVVDFFILSSKGLFARSIISRIVLSATCYFIWKERNARLFKKKSKSHILIYESIVATIDSIVHDRLGDMDFLSMGVPFESCTIFSFSKVFLTGFFRRFFKEAVSIVLAYAPLVDAASLDLRIWIATMA